MYLAINKWEIAVKFSNFSGQYLRNNWTLDIGVLGYIGIVWPKEHSPEVRSFPPGNSVHIYRMIQEESAILLEMIVWVILSKKIHSNMGPIVNGHGVMTAWNWEEKVTIIDNERKKIITQHNTWYI